MAPRDLHLKLVAALAGVGVVTLGLVTFEQLSRASPGWVIHRSPIASSVFLVLAAAMHLIPVRRLRQARRAEPEAGSVRHRLVGVAQYHMLLLLLITSWVWLVLVWVFRSAFLVLVPLWGSIVWVMVRQSWPRFTATMERWRTIDLDEIADRIVSQVVQTGLAVTAVLLVVGSSSLFGSHTPTEASAGFAQRCLLAAPVAAAVTVLLLAYLRTLIRACHRDYVLSRIWSRHRRRAKQ